MSRFSVRIGFVLVLTLLLAACGGKKSEVATAPTRTASEPTAAATVRGATTAPGVPALSSRFCGDWTGMAAQTAKFSGQPSGPATDLKTSLEATTALMKASADQAPAEIKADFQVYAKFWSDYAAVMAKANYDFSKIATDTEMQKMMQSMSDPKLQQAGLNIQAWVQKNCVR